MRVPTQAGDRPLTLTYRMQFGEAFGFDAAIDLLPHLERLGVSHLYASPITTARPGSTHGYDVVDPTSVSPALGGRAGLERLVERLHARAIGLIVDIVPNHMAADAGNAAWMEVLELGRTAPSAAIFDIDWSQPHIALPYLEAAPETCVAEGKLHLRLDASAARILLVHHDRRLPLRPLTAARLILEATRDDDHGDLAAAAAAWAELDGREADAAAVAAARSRLASALAAAPAAVARLEARLDSLAAGADGGLLAVLDEQHWWLSDWRTRCDDVGYRRFFEIDDLVGVRVEDPAVFAYMHALPVELVRSGLVDGLRVDHIDGLADPAGYAAALRRAIGNRASLHVEKILIGAEELRPWPVDGTTGYEALNWINRLFISPPGYDRLREAAHADAPSLAEPSRVPRAKREMLERAFRPDLRLLARLAGETDDRAAGAEGPESAALEAAIATLACAFPVYRSYLAGGGDRGADIALIRAALRTGYPEEPAETAPVEKVVRLLFDRDDPAAAAFRRRFQQLTGALMAKGYEDTELFRHVVLASANEVGGEIVAPALAPPAFHARFAYRQRHWPRALTPLSTHDSKLSGDLRARLDVLSECAEEWASALERWRALAAPLIVETEDGPMPDRLDQSIILQALAGAWPISAERLAGFVVKALREAKRRSDWIAPDEAYEAAAVAFATALVDDPRAEAFRADFAAFLEPVVRAGRANSLAQTVIQMTAPGVPDIFQGTEAWDLSLVDPDNRRPIDWARLASADFDAAPEDVRDDADGLSKTAAIAGLGRLRRERPALFLAGDYLPLGVTKGGAASDEVVAFARTHAGEAVLTVAAVRGLAAGNGLVAAHALAVPPALNGDYRDAVAGREVTLSGQMPLAALIAPGRPAAVFVRAAT